jgi:DNA-binding SARP family transcriptional activator
VTASTIEIGVLGPVTVRGAAEPFRRSASLELVVYLALHRHRVRNDEWASALWPGRTVSLSTVHSTASDARRALGKAVDGCCHLPRGGRHLLLADSVTTDVDHFMNLASSGDLESMIAALVLVRGRLSMAFAPRIGRFSTGPRLRSSPW